MGGVYRGPSASAAATASTATAGGSGGGRGREGDRGEQLDGVGVPLRARSGSTGLAHRPVHVEGPGTLTAPVGIGRHARIFPGGRAARKRGGTLGPPAGAWLRESVFRNGGCIGRDTLVFLVEHGSRALMYQGCSSAVATPCNPVPGRAGRGLMCLVTAPTTEAAVVACDGRAPGQKIRRPVTSPIAVCPEDRLPSRGTGVSVSVTREPGGPAPQPGRAGRPRDRDDTARNDAPGDRRLFSVPGKAPGPVAGVPEMLRASSHRETAATVGERKR